MSDVRIPDLPVDEYKTIYASDYNSVCALRQILPILWYKVVSEDCWSLHVTFKNIFKLKLLSSTFYTLHLHRDIRKAKHSVLGINDEFLKEHFGLERLE